MKHAYSLLLLCLLMLTIGCEKSVGDEDGADNGVITGEMMSQALTVPQAIATEGGLKVTVKGYIVAAAESNIKKSDFRAPFEGSSALVLAKRKSDGTTTQFGYDELLPICLTDAAKGIRDTYNLEENNQYHNCYVYIYGTRKEYMNQPGIKKVQEIRVDYNHQPTADEEAAASPEEPGGEGTGEGGEGTGEGGEGTGEGGEGGGAGEQSTLTVAQAIQDAVLYDDVLVKGYLVATTKRSMNSANFTPDFSDYTAFVLADRPADTPEMIQHYQENLAELFPVGISSSSRKELNLAGHPEYHNRLIVVFGAKRNYLGQPGIDEAVYVVFNP